jgi:hypothetical protein
LGKGPELAYGFVVKATLIAVPMAGGHAVELRLEAELEDKGVMILYVSWAVCLPVAPLLFYLAWRDYEARQKALMQAVWSVAAPAFGGQSYHQLPSSTPGW